MTTVTLSALLDARDESLSVRRARPAWLSAVRRAVAGVRWGAASAGVVAAVLALAGVLSRHGLVLAGLASFVIAAALIAPVAAFVTAGVSLLFLEVRRR